MHVLMPRPAAGAETGGPVHDERVRDTTFMGVALEPLERSVPGPGPSPRVVVVGLGGSEVVDPLEVLFEALGDEIEEILLVERSPGATLGRCTVVAHDDHDRVLGLTELLDEVEEACHLRVRMAEEPGEDLHEPSGESLLVGAQRVPGRDPRGALGELRSGGQESRGQLAGEHLLPPPVPALVEVPPVRRDGVGGSLVRRMAGSGCEPQKEGSRRRGSPKVGEVADGVVRQVLGQVVPLVRTARRLDRLVVADQLGVVLVRLSSHEAVVPIETTPQGPLVAGAAGRHLGGRRQVPLSDSEGGVPVRAEYLGQEPVLFRDRRVVARKARRRARPRVPCRSSGGSGR